MKFALAFLTFFWVCSDDVRFEAKWTSYALNIAIGLQVLLGALTTGISAALSGKQVGLKVNSDKFTTY
jgi:TPP-dependent indolepyruvate ferredoxin oxidoreductase alpha subunit